MADKKYAIYTILAYEPKTVQNGNKILPNVLHTVELLRKAALYHPDGGMNGDAAPEFWFEIDWAPYGHAQPTDPKHFQIPSDISDLQRFYEGWSPNGALLPIAPAERGIDAVVLNLYNHYTFPDDLTRLPNQTKRFSRQQIELAQIARSTTIPYLKLGSLKDVSYTALLTQEAVRKDECIDKITRDLPNALEHIAYKFVTAAQEPIIVPENKSISARFSGIFRKAEPKKEQPIKVREYSPVNGIAYQVGEEIYKALVQRNKMHPATLNEIARRAETHREDIKREQDLLRTKLEEDARKAKLAQPLKPMIRRLAFE